MPNTPLSKAQIKQIALEFGTKKTAAQLALEFGVRKALIFAAVHKLRKAGVPLRISRGTPYKDAIAELEAERPDLFQNKE